MTLMEYYCANTTVVGHILEQDFLPFVLHVF